MCPLTRSCFLLLLGSFSLLVFPSHFGTCLCSLWSPPFFPHAPIPIPLFFAKVRFLTHFDSRSRQMALFQFLLAKAALASLSLSNFVALMPPFLFFAGLECFSFSAEAAPYWRLFAGPGSTNKSAIFLLFFGSHSVLATLFSPSFLSPQTLWQIWPELSSLSSLLPENDAADAWARRGRYLCPL